MKLDPQKEYELMDIVRDELIPGVNTYTKAYGLVTRVSNTTDAVNRFGFSRSGNRKIKRVPREGKYIKIKFRLEKKFGDNYKYYILGKDILSYIASK